MDVRDVLVSPPVAGCIFMALAAALYRLGGALAARGKEHPGKRLPYACGEDLLLPDAQLDYRAFFRLALMFALLHLATLVVSTLPPGRESHLVALFYLLGIVVSVLVVVKGAED